MPVNTMTRAEKAALKEELLELINEKISPGFSREEALERIRCMAKADIGYVTTRNLVMSW